MLNTYCGKGAPSGSPRFYSTSVVLLSGNKKHSGGRRSRKRYDGAKRHRSRWAAMYIEV